MIHPSERGFNKFKVQGALAFLELTNRHGLAVGETIVDLSDLTFLESEGKRWSLYKPQGRKIGYVMRNRKDGTRIYLHRYLTVYPRGMVIDHINRDGLDNRRENLRIVTQAVNMQNLGPVANSQTGLRGVAASRSKKFPYVVSVGTYYNRVFRLPVRTLNIARITAMLARVQHWGVEAA